MPRRRWLRSTCLLIVVLVVGACGSGGSGASGGANGKEFSGRTLRVATWGGDWGAGVKASTGTLFEQQTGATVEYVLGNPADNMTKLLAAPAGDPPFDVMQVDHLTEATLIQKNLIDKVDHTKLPMKDLFEQAQVTPDYGPAFTLVPVVITWSPAKFKELGLPDPTSFDDLFAPALKGKIAYPGMTVGFAPLILSGLAEAWFGDEGKVEDAMTKLKTAEPRIYGATAEMATWLTNGEVVAAVTHTSQVQVMRNQGFDLGMVYPTVGSHRSMVYWNTVDIIHGTKNQDMALKWLQMNLGCDAQRLFGQRNGVLPTCASVAAEFAKDPKLKTISVTAEDMSAMFQQDPAYILSNRDAWNASWSKVMGS